MSGIYPIKVIVSYKSGRTERITVRQDWPDEKAALCDAMSHGAITSFSYQQNDHTCPSICKPQPKVAGAV